MVPGSVFHAIATDDMNRPLLAWNGDEPEVRAPFFQLRISRNTRAKNLSRDL